jgi:hypothetical protein
MSTRFWVGHSRDVTARIQVLTVRDHAERFALGATLLAPGALLVVFALDDGGFFPDAWGLATLGLLNALALRALLARRPFAGLTPAGMATVGMLALLAVWTLASAAWSDAESRALLEYARLLLYAAVLGLFVTLPSSEGRALVVLAGLAAAATAVSAAALGVWLLPDRFPVDDAFGRARLNWPTSYWNATALIAALGAVWCAHLATTTRVGAAPRVLASTALPLLAATVYFSASRGAAAAGLAGAVALVALQRSRGLFTGLPVVLAGAVAGVVIAAGADGLNAIEPSRDALADGRTAVRLLVLAAAGAGLARLALVPVDRRLAAARLPRPSRRLVLIVSATVVAAGAGVFVAAGAPAAISGSFDRFVEDEGLNRDLDPSERFTRIENNNRLNHWEVALEAGFAERPLSGTGAGTYALLWDRERQGGLDVLDGHSLYVEMLGELGLVGLFLLLAVLGPLLWALGRRAWQTGGAWTGLFAAALTWAVHAGVDWDWEMPAVTAWLFAAGGLALAAPAAAGSGVASPGRSWRALAPRTAVAVACALLALVPLALVPSQRHVVRAIAAVRDGDCRRGSEEALDSQAALASRPEPYELLAYCESRAGRTSGALRLIGEAIERDPQNWELLYARALILARAGRDPRRDIEAAIHRNPRHPLVRDAADALAGDRPAAWRRFARTAPLPLPPR